jgi:insertion element IS1 protein InsB
VIPTAQHRPISKLARKTNHVERFNNTLRQRVSRLVSEALSFSKKLANHIGALKLFICHYNLTICVHLSRCLEIAAAGLFSRCRLALPTAELI